MNPDASGPRPSPPPPQPPRPPGPGRTPAFDRWAPAALAGLGVAFICITIVGIGGAL